MAFNTRQFSKFIIAPALEKLGMHSDSAVNLLLGTMATESHFGTYIHQKGNGPALGVYQMEPATHDDIVLNYLKRRRSLQKLLERQFGLVEFRAERLLHDLQYATIFARLHYYRVSEPLPLASNTEGLARYWKEYYNTRFGKGTEDDFIKNYTRFVGR
jgi:hypothetical protein